jgi:hypothetical protein
MEFKYKKGQRVLLRDDAMHAHQKYKWHEGYAIILEPYWSDNNNGPWYRIETPSKYRNSYPEGDLYPVGFDSNKDAKSLLSKEW